MIPILALAVLALSPPQDREAGQLTWVDSRTLRASDGQEIQGTRGALLVPENRSDPESDLIELAFAHLASTADEPGHPLVYLAGGPGQAALPYARDVDRWMGLLSVCDVIFLDQRGIGDSVPNLVYRPTDVDPSRFFLDEEAALEIMVAGLRQGAEHFRSRGVDLAGYTTAESADDLNDLRLALGAEKLNLLGFSYGTHLAQAAIKRHGEHLANVIVCGVEGLGHTHKLPSTMDTAFRKLALLAARDPVIADEVPDLVALLDEALAKLAEEPMIVQVVDARGQTVEVPVGPFGLRHVLRRDIGDRSDIIVFPKLLVSILEDDPRMLQWFVQKRYPNGTSLMTWVCDGASGATPARWERIRAEARESSFGNVMNFPFPDLYDVLEIPRPGRGLPRPHRHRRPHALPLRLARLEHPAVPGRGGPLGLHALDPPRRRGGRARAGPAPAGDPGRPRALPARRGRERRTRGAAAVALRADPDRGSPSREPDPPLRTARLTFPAV